MRHSIRVVYPRLVRRGPFLLAALALCLVPLCPARAQVIGEAVELERTGRQASAAVVYMAVLRGEPTNLAALLGLERVLPPVGRPPELLPPVRRAPAAAPPDPGLPGGGGGAPAPPHEPPRPGGAPARAGPRAPRG